MAGTTMQQAVWADLMSSRAHVRQAQKTPMHALSYKIRHARPHLQDSVILLFKTTCQASPPKALERLTAEQSGPANTPAQVEATAAAAAAAADASGPLLHLNADAPAWAGGATLGASRPHLWRGLTQRNPPGAPLLRLPPGVAAP